MAPIVAAMRLSVLEAIPVAAMRLSVLEAQRHGLPTSKRATTAWRSYQHAKAGLSADVGMPISAWPSPFLAPIPSRRRARKQHECAKSLILLIADIRVTVIMELVRSLFTAPGLVGLDALECSICEGGGVG